MIRGSWDLQRFLDRGAGAAAAAAAAAPVQAAAAPVDGHDAAAADRYTDVGTVAAGVDHSLRTPFFWAFVHLLASLNSVLTHMSAWCASCKCHSARTEEVSG